MFTRQNVTYIQAKTIETFLREVHQYRARIEEGEAIELSQLVFHFSNGREIKGQLLNIGTGADNGAILIQSIAMKKIVESDLGKQALATQVENTVSIAPRVATPTRGELRLFSHRVQSGGATPQATKISSPLE